MYLIIMRHGVAVLIFLALIAVFPSGLSAQGERPSWARDTNPADFPVEVASIALPDGFVWDGDHPSMTVGRWQISRNGPLTEHLSTCVLRGHPGCFGATIAAFECYNPPAGPEFSPCTLTLDWSQHKEGRWEAECNIEPQDASAFARFPISCPAEIRFVK